MEEPTDQPDPTVSDESQVINTSTDSNKDTNGRVHNKKEQFTSKQRLDMYAFCVLELEMHGNTVSIKKRQQALKKALSNGQIKKEPQSEQSTDDLKGPESGQAVITTNSTATGTTTATPTATTSTSATTDMDTAPATSTNTALLTNIAMPSPKSAITSISQAIIHQPGAKIVVLTQDMARQLQKQGAIVQRIDEADVHMLTNDEKTLEQLQREISSNLKCYSDYQRTQVLTAAMLKNVQARFAKYYPNTVVPSRTTIKHVFEKCVSHGTVDNIKNPRKPSKITQGNEIEQLLEREPQLSLRQLAVRLNVSVGTVSRRCKAMGLIPESVTIKHQQLAIARRQKQIKQQGDTTPTKPPAPRRGRPPKTTPNGCITRRQNGQR